MLRTTFLTFFLLATLGAAHAQEGPANSPPIRLNMINSCSPADAEQKEIAAVLAMVPAKPVFVTDFEISRGRTAGKQGISDWVRLLREFPANSALTTAQFSLTVDGGNIVERIMLHFKAAKAGEPLQLSLEGNFSAGSPVQVVSLDTPPNRVRLERFGKPSLILARCPEADQKAYEPLFQTAAELSARYKAALEVRTTVPGELARLKPEKKAAK